jgi:hypothetical protein
MNRILYLIICIFIFQGCKVATVTQPSLDTPYTPSDSPHPAAYYDKPIPSLGFTAALGWMQAVDIDGKGTPSKVEVDWMRLHVIVHSIDTVLYEDSFEYLTTPMNYYGLWNRTPWVQDPKVGTMPFIISNGTLLIEPNTNPNLVFHWWSTHRSLLPQGTTRVWFESRVRIIGGAGVENGIDYYKDTIIAPLYNINNVEAGRSNWFGNSTTDWQIITIGKP